MIGVEHLVGVSAGTSVNTANMAKKSHDLALILASEKCQKVKFTAEEAAMEAEVAKLVAMIQQGSPHRSGSGNSPSIIDQGGSSLQGL